MSKLYKFILNMWIMGIDETFIENVFQKEYNLEAEKGTIMAIPQV